jgi:nucleoside phosphorylase
VLDGVPKSAIVVNKVAVKTLDLKKLKVFTEDVDHKTIYKDIMTTNGINRVDIAAMGRKGELKKMLADEGLEPDVELTLPNFNTTVYHLKTDAGEKVLAAFQLSPDFFGDRSGALTEALQELGVKHITFVGTAGGLGADVNLNDLFVPSELANAAETTPRDDVTVSGKRAKNAAFTQLEALKTAAKVETPTLKSGGLHVGVHSPITESMEMIKWMKKTSVQSVDCEAGFIADVLKGSEVSLYALYFIGDIPGTHHSIGMGGTSASDESADGDTTATGTKELATSEKLVKAVIKSVVGEKIEKASREDPDLPSVNKLGQIPILYGAKREKRFLQITVVEPPVATTGSTVGVLRTFGRSLKDMPREAPKKKDKRPPIVPVEKAKEKEERPLLVDTETMNELNRRAATFSSIHKVKLLLDVV